MTWFAVSGRLARAAFVVATAAAGVMVTEAAFASQGPGANAGTASSLTQLAMAIAVYGISGLIVAAGLIGAARGRSRLER